MLVEHIMPRARERLVVIDAAASIADAALRLARSETDLLVVCDGEIAIGLVTRTDIVRVAAQTPFDISAGLSTIMTREIVTCCSADDLIAVWSAMSAHRFQRVPVLADTRRPIGVVYARDALQALLQDAEHEDEVLRAYIQGVGYH